MPARQYNFKTKNSGYVTIPLALEAHQARAFMGMSLQDYEALPGTRACLDEEHSLSKSDVIAIYRLTRLVDNIQQDMSIAASKRKH